MPCTHKGNDSVIALAVSRLIFGGTTRNFPMCRRSPSAAIRSECRAWDRGSCHSGAPSAPAREIFSAVLGTGRAASTNATSQWQTTDRFFRSCSCIVTVTGPYTRDMIGVDDQAAPATSLARTVAAPPVADPSSHLAAVYRDSLGLRDLK